MFTFFLDLASSHLFRDNRFRQKKKKNFFLEKTSKKSSSILFSYFSREEKTNKSEYDNLNWFGPVVLSTRSLEAHHLRFFAVHQAKC